MNDKIKEAFRQIQAEEPLKDRTKAFLAQKTKSSAKPVKRRFPMYAAACACLLFLLVMGHRLYFTQTSIISIDINPSLELGINRFDRVISVNSLNDDARELTAAMDIKFRHYEEAVRQILENKKIAAMLSDDEEMVITVAGSDETQSAQILSKLEGCTAGHKNTHCYHSSSAEVTSAHEAGLSCGKYRAFLELQLLDPEITPETVQGMTMSGIRDLIDRLSDGDAGVTKEPSPAGETSPACETPQGQDSGCGRHESHGGHGGGHR